MFSQVKALYKPITALIIACLLLFIMLIATCQSANGLRDRLNAAESYNGKLKKRTVNDSLQLFTQDIKLTRSDRDLKALKKRLELANIEQATEAKVKTVIKTEFKIGEPLIIHDTIYVLKLPIEFNRSEKWFNMAGRINRLGLFQLDSLVTYARFTHSIGDTVSNRFLGGLFAKRGKVVRVAIDNPYMSVTGLNNIYVRREPKWYELGVVKFGAGFILGAAFIAAAN
jgi:hypothetical protein